MTPEERAWEACRRVGIRKVNPEAISSIADAIRQAIVAEREACAKVVREWDYGSKPIDLEAIAAAIRSRSTEVNGQ